MKTMRFHAMACLITVLSLAFLPLQSSRAQTEVTGAITGKVISAQTNEPIAGATVRFTNKDTGMVRIKLTDREGKFYQGLLPPGIYKISISAPGFKPKEVELRLSAATENKVMPFPIALEPEQPAQP